MDIVLFFTPLILIVAATLVWWYARRSATAKETFHHLHHFQFDGLFAKQRAKEARELAEAEDRSREDETRERLLNRAAENDLGALDEAYKSGDEQFYAEVLRMIAVRADGNPEILRSIVEYIVNSQELRSSGELAETIIGLWNELPDRLSFADMLYLAALADDAELFRRAISIALGHWKAGSLSTVSARDFLATVESAYWLVAGDVRYSGSGFLLKQAVADVRRELAAANRRSA